MKESLNIVIENEQTADFRSVEELTREAFWNVNVPGCNEHFLAHRLREHEDFIPKLSFVAEINGKIIGNIMYCRAKIVLLKGDEVPVLTFGPLSVLPEYQRHGVGSALIRLSIKAAIDLGYHSILIYGDPAYYCRFGFRPAQDFLVTTSFGSFHPALQALEIVKGSLLNAEGRFFEGPAYQVDETEAEIFDRSFPKKEKFVTESQKKFARLAGLPIPE